MRHKRKRRGGTSVELNLAAMLDMAFQLLTFFILTFRPAPIEGQLLLNLPEAKAAIPLESAQQPNDAPQDAPGPTYVRSLIITVPSTPNGDVRSAKVGIAPVFTGPATASNLYRLEQRLKTVVSMQETAFEQVLIMVGKDLRYEELMKIIDVCTKQKMPNGERVKNISFAEFDDTEG